ncbi:E3 ubiquitin-protein ligase BRE1-like 1 [Hondaea fermentalgiana]|uniref:E3 ubiquitin-protein ligase BRE1-like 1 n=1 Tax=Hondaea fermentalgiana TaxID=2315210 RepID=A0A2R5GIK3_9STRA|nr:E3 ubiquitin-protein ligase BRE1-like 1 [Hondaea fermentalgiana]|eukprot:GBG29558.1 E3 ubiquitin-protein ligase BRE1-like 1 [Hondaea fermentalgiana]
MTANFRMAAMQLENLRAMEKLLECGLCNKLLDNPYSTDCEHHFCKTCIDDALFDQSKCPTCGLPVRPRDLARNPTFCNIVGSVSKLRAALTRLETRREERARKSASASHDIDATQSPVKRSRNEVENPATETANEPNDENDPMQIDQDSRPTPARETLKPTAAEEALAAAQQRFKERQAHAQNEADARKSPKEKERAVSSGAQDGENHSSQAQATQDPAPEPSKMTTKPHILVTGLEGEDLDRCIVWVERLGGEYLRKFEYKSHVTHVIAKPRGQNKAGETEVKNSPKFIFGQVVGSELVTPAWIEACNASGDWVDEEPYRIKPTSSVLTGKLSAGEIPDKTMLGQFDYIFTADDVHRPLLARWLSKYSSVTQRDMCYLHPKLTQQAETLHDLVPQAQTRDLLDDFPDKSRMTVVIVERCPRQNDATHDRKACSYCLNVHRLRSHFERSVLLEPRQILNCIIRNRPLRPNKPPQSQHAQRQAKLRQGKIFKWPEPELISSLKSEAPK